MRCLLASLTAIRHKFLRNPAIPFGLSLSKALLIFHAHHGFARDKLSASSRVRRMVEQQGTGNGGVEGCHSSRHRDVHAVIAGTPYQRPQTLVCLRRPRQASRRRAHRSASLRRDRDATTQTPRSLYHASEREVRNATQRQMRLHSTPAPSSAQLAAVFWEHHAMHAHSLGGA